MFRKIAAFVVPLGFDTFAVAVLLGLRGMRPLRPAATFTFFEGVMPLVGLLIGRLVGARFKTPAVLSAESLCLAWRSKCSPLAPPSDRGPCPKPSLQAFVVRESGRTTV